uniref:Osteoclast-stimulating factor 1 n=1 Tax=Nothobranchius furzeri TaxID=105023 RepID=A0A8C6VVE4_NOTFU
MVWTEVLVEFDYDALHDDELTLRPGDVIKNVRCLVDEDGWMEGELNGKRGVFPDNFVKEVKKETKTEPNPTAAPSKRKSGNVANLVNRMSTILPTGGFQPVPPAASNKPKKRRCKVLFDYQPFNEDELELKVGDVVDIVEEVEEGWWSGSLKGKSGLFPSNFVEELEIAGEEAEPNSPSVVTTPTSPSPASGNSAICQPTKVPRIGFGDIFKNQSFQLKSTQKEEKDQRCDPHPPVDSTLKLALPPGGKKTPEVKYRRTQTEEAAQKAWIYFCFSCASKQDTGESGWWRGEVGGHQGFFPNNFVVLVPEAEKETTTDGKPLKPLPPSVPRKKPVPVPPKKPEKPLASSSSFKYVLYSCDSQIPVGGTETLFDELSLTSDKLPHPTAGRPKFHGRRLPAHFTQSPSRDVNFEKALKDDKEDGGITNSSPPLARPTNTKPTPTVASSVDGDVLGSSKAQLEPSETSSQLDELRSQIKELLLSVELLKTQQTDYYKIHTDLSLHRCVDGTKLDKNCAVRKNCLTKVRYEISQKRLWLLAPPHSPA